MIILEIDKLLEEIIENSIIGRDKYGWNKNEIIRYVYISLGQHINKNIKFFYSANNKFRDNDRLTVEEMKHIQENDASYEVTCKVTAKMLIYILNRLDIQAQLMQTTEHDEYKQYPNSTDKYDIYHFFVCCTGEENKKYFLTLNADLTNIKMGFPTQHFANTINYFMINNKTNQFELDEHGQKKTYYQGKEIETSTISSTELEKIDKKIGYLKQIDDEYKYVPNLKTITKTNIEERYINALIELDENNFYQGLIDLFSKFKKQGLSQLNPEELFELHKYIYIKSINLI